MTNLGQGTLILPFSSSSFFIQSNEKNSFQTIAIPVHKFAFKNISQHQLDQALADRSELSDKLSKLIWQWISEADASSEAVTAISNRQIPDLKSSGRTKMRRSFHPQSAIQLPPEASNIEKLGQAWRNARRTVRIGLLSKIRRTKTNIRPISFARLHQYNLDLTKAKFLTEEERNALIELKNFDLRSNVFLLPNHRALEKIKINGGRTVSVFKKPRTGSNITTIDALQFLSVDVDGRDLQKRLPHFTLQEIADRIKSNYNRLSLKPDVILASGSLLSFHFHWSVKADRISQQLNSTEALTDRQIEIAKLVQRRLVELLDGDRNAVGINRPWRFPGTVNCKGANLEPKQSGYCDGSRTLEEARLNPRYTLDELYESYAAADSVTFAEETDVQVFSDVESVRPSFMEQIDKGWKDKFETIIEPKHLGKLSESQRHNIAVLFRHIHQFRHRPDAITFLKNGVLKEIRGKRRPYPPFYKATELLNQLATAPIIEKSVPAKWSSNPKQSRSTEYRLTEYGRRVLESEPRAAVDVQEVLETLYIRGDRNKELNRDAIKLFRVGWTEVEVYRVLREKNRMSAEGPGGCTFDETDIRRQIERAREFVQNMKKMD